MSSPRKVPPPTMKVHLKRREKISQKRKAKARRARRARRTTVKSLLRNLLSSPRRMNRKVHLKMRERRSPAKVVA